MNRTVRRVLSVLLLAGIATGVIYALRPKPVAVDVARVTSGPLQVTIDEDAQTRAHDRFTVTAPVAGMLSRTSLHEGDAVTSDSIIAVIHPLPVDSREDAEIRARIAAAEALGREAEKQVVAAETSHQQAQRDFSRAEALYRQGIMPRERFEEAQSKEITLAEQVEAARYRATAAAAELRRAEAGLISSSADRKGKAKPTAIRVPAEGRILRLIEKSEAIVAAGTPIAIISNPRKLEIVADLLSTDAVKVAPGAAVLVENWGGPNPLRARVRTVEPFGFTKISALGIEEQRVNVIADFMDSPANLGDGYRLDVRIVIWECADVVKVPANVLFRSGQDWNVFVVEDGVAHLRSVEVGHRNALEAEILNGLQTGELVILHPASELASGVSVVPRSAQVPRE